MRHEQPDDKEFRLLRHPLLSTALIFFWTLVCLPYPALAEEVVQSSGIGVILQGDVEAARKRALEKAYQDAIKESVATLFFFTDLENFNRAVEEILENPPLYYINRYRLLTDMREENLYKVSLEVSISGEKIKKKLTEAGMLQYREESLQLGIMIATKFDNLPSEEFFNAEEQDFTPFAVQQCRTRGFQVISGSISVDDSPKSFEKLRVNNQLTALQGRRLGTDAVILGQIMIGAEESRLGNQIPGDYHVSIWIRAVRSTDASLLGIRETAFTLKQNISRFMLRQLIHQNLDALLADLGKDIRKNME